MYNSGYSKSDFIESARNLVKNRSKYKTNEEIINTWDTWIKYGYPQNFGYLVNLTKLAA